MYSLGGIWKYFAVIILCCETVQSECPDGFVVHQETCFAIMNIRATWDEAQTYCDAYGATLATINSNDDEAFVTGLIQRSPQGAFNSGIFWLGASDSASEGRWVWLPQGNAISLTFWNQGQPDNAGTGENCLTVSASDNYRWNDNVCSHKYNFVCQYRTNGGLGVSG